ncbi:Hypothetical protein I5071_57120 [Sandaracinus amylolyticus]|nr:Hypothetical protein I5071_57120 [Sandaracinus amylolyticus]
MAALVSAFDPESHRVAMTKRFFRILRELDYPEVHELCLSYREIRQMRQGSKGISFSSVYSDNSGSAGDERSTHRARLAELGLVRCGSARQWSPTWLGLMLVEFLERGGYPPKEPDDSSPGEANSESA